MIPVHIGIIPDGNRRYGKKHGLSIRESYARGISKLEHVLEWSKEVGIKIVTVWGFSTENLRRSAIEKKIFFGLLENKIKEMMKSEKIEKNKTCIKIIGKKSFFPKSLANLFDKLEAKTKKYKSFKLNLALGYGGRQEIVDACNRILKSGLKFVNPETFSKYLYTGGITDPELIIRTSGEQRLSGFMPWQSTYSEFIFLKPLWPELRKKDFFDAIKEFEQRTRRFGR